MWRLVIGVPILVIVLLCLFVLTPAIASCGDHGELVTRAIESCPRARELIGDDAHPARIGWACGTTELEGNYGRASWSVPVTGSRGRGSVDYDASKHAGDWALDRATLEVDDETIDLVACSQAVPRKPSPAALAQTNADAVTAKIAGKVIRSTHPTIGLGATCRGELDRPRGSPRANIKVTCDTPESVQIYEGTGSFALEVGVATRHDDDRREYDDAKTTDVDGTPGCRWSSSGNTGTLTIWDASPAYEIVVEL